MQSICDRKTSDISDSENEDDVDDVNAAYDSDTEEYAGSSSDSDDDGSSGVGISQRRPLWKAANSSPANNVPVLETGCVFSEARLEFSPADYYKQYVDDNMLEKMAEKTNQRILRERGIISKITGQEVKQFLGCSMLMGVIGYPRIRFFWKKGLAVSSVADTMPRDRFFLLRSNLCCQLDDDISDDDKKSERLWKVAPFVEMVRKGCLGLERPNCFCVDEQVIPFSGRCPMKQYIPNKPNPVGLKNFVLAGKDGLIYDFAIYKGKETFPDFGLGISGNSVLKLVETVPACSTLYCDRWFSSVGLMDELMKKGIFGTGTLMKNRMPKEAHFTNDKDLLKKSRGTSEQRLRQDSTLACTKWVDKKPIVMLSAAFGVEPEDKCKRWCKKDKKFLDVPRPSVIRNYNANMGGVDLADRMLSLYAQRSRTNRWTLRTILHMSDLACVNSWLQYRADKKAEGVQRKNILEYLDFKLCVAEALIWQKVIATRQEDEDDLDIPPRKRPKALPSEHFRKTDALHLPMKDDLPNGARCRNAGCSMKTRHRCARCDVYLCIEVGRDCFYEFHS